MPGTPFASVGDQDWGIRSYDPDDLQERQEEEEKGEH